MGRRLIICDDHVMFSDMLREYMEATTDLEVVHTQPNTENLIEALKEHKPDLLLSDLVLPGPDIYGLLEKVLKKFPDLRILVMSGMFNASNTSRLHKIGVHGIASKMGQAKEIVEVINRLLEGQIHYPQDFLDKLENDPASVAPKISKREVEIMVLISRGMSEKQIAAKLDISENTVNNHKGNIFSKLGVQNQVSMVVEGIRQGLIPNPILDGEKKSSDS